MNVPAAAPLAQRLQDWQRPVLRWWAERPVRERLLLVLAGIGAVGVLVDSSLNLPLERKLKQARGQVAAQQAQLDSLRAVNGPQGAVQTQREAAERLQQRVAQAQAAAEAMRGSSADTARLPETLRALVGTVGAARLVSLDLSGDTAVASSASPTATRLFRLPVTLTVAGNYDELQLLLTQIERHAEPVHWTSLQLDSTQWPSIQMTLKAHVLSPEPRWGAAS